MALALIWIGCGLLAGLFAGTARLGSALAGRERWLALPALGAALALAGGALSLPFFDRMFTPFTALLVSVSGLLALRALMAINARRRADATTN